MAAFFPGTEFGAPVEGTQSLCSTEKAVVQDESSYPVLIFMEGLNGLRQMNTFQVEELVSHGYIVAAIDQPYAAAEVVFPDGRKVGGLSKDQLNVLLQQSISPVTNAPTLNGRTLKDGIIPYFAQDAVFTLHQLASLNQADPTGILTGHLDVKRAGIFGVSLGGMVSPEACHLEHRLRACLVMEAPATLLDGPAAQYPEVPFDTRRP
jgi:Platelet-activating factor acetylhydrolase, isoform II